LFLAKRKSRVGFCFVVRLLVLLFQFDAAFLVRFAICEWFEVVWLVAKKKKVTALKIGRTIGVVMSNSSCRL
jgi:hypothetical protein